MTTDLDVICSIRLPAVADATATAIAKRGPRGLKKSAVLREAILAGLPLVEQRVEAMPPRPPPALTQRHRAWERKLRDLHGQGLTNADLAREMAWTPANVRRKLAILGLESNPSRS